MRANGGKNAVAVSSYVVSERYRKEKRQPWSHNYRIVWQERWRIPIVDNLESSAGIDRKIGDFATRDENDDVATRNIIFRRSFYRPKGSQYPRYRNMIGFFADVLSPSDDFKHLV